MNYEKMILEMFDRIVTLEEKVTMLENAHNTKQASVAAPEEYKSSKKYRFLSTYLKDSEEYSIKLTFSEIESILQFKLADSAKKHKEFWANSTSHSIALSWLSVNYKTVEVNLEEEYIVFEKNISNQNPHSQFWSAFNEYAKKDGRLLSYFKKLYNVTYESRYELSIAPNFTQIAFSRNVKDKNIIIEFHTRNKELFDVIKVDKVSIENELGLNFEWKRLDDKLATRITYKKEFAFDYDNVSIYNWLIETAIKMKTVFSRYL